MKKEIVKKKFITESFSIQICEKKKKNEHSSFVKKTANF